MGRKPNQLILEFFERGQKLEDASNRYQHTCKACGEKFPKGRIDSLTTHLFKKCPSIPRKDRQRAFMQLHDLPDGESPEAAAAGVGGETVRRSRSGKGGIGKGQTVDLPIGTRNWTALETLAEVSRQIDLNEHTKDGSPAGEGQAPSREGSVAAAERGAGKGKRRSDKRSSSHRPGSKDHQGAATIAEGVSPDSFSTTSAGGPALPPIQISGTIFDSPSQSPRLPGLKMADDVIDPALQTILPSRSVAQQIAGAVQNVLAQPGRTLEPKPTPQDAGLSDKIFHPQSMGPRAASTWPMMHGGQIQPSDMAFFEGSGSRDLPGGSGGIIDGLAMRAATFPRPIAMNPDMPQRDFTSEFSATNRAMRPKVRGRFTALRRKEVQEVRKRGACIRCRMLKKPCSGESPCSTCRSVESARLWKQPCIRTRIADELDIYSAGLYSVLAHHSTSRIQLLFSFSPLPTTLIGATHLPSTTISLPCLARSSQPRSPPGPSLLNPPLSPPSTERPMLILDAPSSTSPSSGSSSSHSPFPTPTTLQSYLITISPQIFALEPPSSFISPTLSLATKLSSQKADTLLTRVLELWTATTLLVDPASLWSLTSSPIPESSSPNHTGTDAFPPMPLSPSDEPYRLITTQLSSLLETRCAALSKQILHELERRLLQRGQSGWFETFLVAVILLNAVERACWAFAAWDGLPTTNTSADASGARQGEEEGAKTWPLDKPPSYFIERGERFAEMLGVLLRMRGMPPKTLIGNTGGGGGGDGGKSGGNNSGAGNSGNEEEELMAREFLDGVLREVGERAVNGMGGVEGRDMRAGEGRFVSKLLLNS